RGQDRIASEASPLTTLREPGAGFAQGADRLEPGLAGEGRCSSRPRSGLIGGSTSALPERKRNGDAQDRQRTGLSGVIPFGSALQDWHRDSGPGGAPRERGGGRGLRDRGANCGQAVYGWQIGQRK